MNRTPRHAVRAHRGAGGAALGASIVLVGLLATTSVFAQDRECEQDQDCGFGFECFHSASSGTTGGGPAVCGNNICEFASESIESCPADCDRYTECTPVECVTDADCADQYACEELPLPGSAATGGPRCGDSVCNGSETRASCPEDCVPERRCQLRPTYCSSDEECPDGLFCSVPGSSTGAGGIQGSTAGGVGGSSAVSTGSVATVSSASGTGSFSQLTASTGTGGSEAGGSAGMGNEAMGTCRPEADGTGGAMDSGSSSSSSAQAATGVGGSGTTASASSGTTTGSGNPGTGSGTPGEGGMSNGGAGNMTGSGGIFDDGATTGNGVSGTSTGSDSGATSSSASSGATGETAPGTAKDHGGCAFTGSKRGGGLFALLALALAVVGSRRGRERRTTR